MDDSLKASWPQGSNLASAVLQGTYREGQLSLPAGKTLSSKALLGQSGESSLGLVAQVCITHSTASTLNSVLLFLFGGGVGVWGGINSVGFKLEPEQL